MVDIAATLNSTQAGTTSTATKQGLSQMSSDDFLEVLLKELQYQDPMKPMDSSQMLAQMSQIRNMEMSTTLTDSLKTLTQQQRLGSAATLIGQYVTGTVTSTDGTETRLSGVVRGIRFESNGEPVLELDSGASLPLKVLQNVTDPNRFVGKYVEGSVTDDKGASTDLSGVVKAVTYSQDGSAWLQLENGDLLPVSGVTRVSQATTTTSTATTSEASDKTGGLTAKVVLG